MAELAPLQTFLFEHGEVIGRSSLRFKLLFNQKEILWRSSLRFKLLFNQKEILRRSSLRFKLFSEIKKRNHGGACSASCFC